MSDITNNIPSEKFSFTMRLKSFSDAWSGVKSMLVTEHNSRVHLVLTIAALLSGLVLKISKLEFSLLVVVISMVWIAELFNTCIEKIMDYLTLEKHPQIKRIKDIAAAAVLLASVSALIVGAIIFIPKIFNYVAYHL